MISVISLKECFFSEVNRLLALNPSYYTNSIDSFVAMHFASFVEAFDSKRGSRYSSWR